MMIRDGFYFYLRSNDNFDVTALNKYALNEFIVKIYVWFLLTGKIYKHVAKMQFLLYKTMFLAF